MEADRSNEPPQRPEWIKAPGSPARIAANAETAERDWSFGWIRLRSGARLEDAADVLAELGAEVEGQSGAWVRARLPGDPDRLRAIAEIPGIAGVGAQPPSAKVSASFATEARGRPGQEVVPVFVTLVPADDPDARWRRELERLGAIVGRWDPDTRSYVANVRLARLADLAALDFVAAIEPVPIVEAMNDTAAPAMGADAYRAYTDGEGWTGTVGEGVAIGVMDTGLNINHIDIESGRSSVCGANFIPSVSEEQDLWVDAHGHGTHVTGTLAGNGAADPRYAGMAPLVRHVRFAKVLSSQGFGSDVSILAGMDFLAEPTECSAGGWSGDSVRPALVNMSLSAVSRNFDGRDVAARKLDAVVWDASQLYVVANANSSNRGFSQYGAAKNSLSVGAAWDSGELVGFSSEGPTADGRLAPLVVGTGVDVNSAGGGGRRAGYRRASGTSMASPAVAGVAALVMDGRPLARQRPAFTRALLMSSAVKPDAWLDAPESFPSDNTAGPGALNARYGLGKVSATTSVGDRNEVDGWRSGGLLDFPLQGGYYTWHDFEVPDGATRLDVVMTWDEPPADVIANTVLNDLDLWLDAGADCGGAQCGEHSSRSRGDNVEWVVVRNPRPGTWRAKVVAERVHGQEPRAALAYTVIRGPAVPQLSVVADTDELGQDGEVTLTIATDGYVAAGTRLAMDCRNPDGTPCPFLATWELVDGAPAGQSGTFNEGAAFLALGEIRAKAPRTVRVRLDARWPGDLHFVATSWNAQADSTVVRDSEGSHVALDPPANDAFEAAPDLAEDVAGDLLRSTTEPGEPAFEPGAPRPAGSVWYRWHATAAGPVHFEATLDDAFRDAARSNHLLETRVAVYRVAGDIVASAAHPVASAPWGASFVAERGAEYAVRVAARGRGAPFTLRWRHGGAPANDAFAAVEDLGSGDEGSATGTNAGATLEPGESFGGLAATVWYQWQAPADGWWEFRSSAVHLKVLAFQAAGSTPSFGDIRLASGFPGDRARFPARAGHTYRIAVAAPDAFAAGTGFELSWSPAEANGSNDLLENAFAFLRSETGVRYVSVGTSETVGPDEPPESGVRTGWWSWAAPATAEYTWRLRSPTAGIRLAAFELAATGTDLVALGGTAGSRLDELTFAAEEDSEYRLAVGVESGDAAFRSAFLSATVAWGATPPNDDRPGAVLLTDASGTVRGSNRFATTVPEERIHDVGHSSLWWEFEAPAAGWYVFRIDETWAPFALSAYASAAADVAPGSLELVASSHYEAGGGTAIYVEAAEAGDRFLLRVGTRGDAEGSDFTLRWETAEPPVRLRYAGLAAEGRHEGDDGSSVELSRFVSLALHPGGRALYAKTWEGVAVFDREADGTLAFSGLLRDGGIRLLLWDAPRNRLLSFGGCVVRSYRPVDGDPLTLEPAGESMIDGDPACSDWHVVNEDRVFADQWGSFVFRLRRGRDVSVYSVGEDGGLTHLHTHPAFADDAALSRDGGMLYTFGGSELRALTVGEDGVLREVGAAFVPLWPGQALALDDDAGRAFVWGGGRAGVVDVSDPSRPAVLGTTVELPRESWQQPRCRFAAARTTRAAADAFCANGAGYAVEHRDGGLAITDLVADWHPNRHGDVVPPFRQVRGLATSADGRHAYVAAPQHGILVFERVNNAVPDDHADSRDDATLAGALPWTGRGELVGVEDVDVFRIDLQGSGTLTVRTTGGTDTHGTLTDADGVVLASDHDSGDGLNFEIALAVSMGTHYVEVGGGGGPYTLTVEFEADDPVRGEVTVTITAGPSPIDEGTDAEFTLERSDATGGLTVNVSVTETEQMIAGTAPTTVEFASGATTATLNVPTDDDAVDEPDSVVTATVLAGSGYALGTPSLATVQITDNDVVEPPDGSGIAFLMQRVITTDAPAATWVHAADLDGDGDPDVLSASAGDDKIAWYENLGGGAFSALRVLTTDAGLANVVDAADLDGDGDADVLSASYRDKIEWHENFGDGTFSAPRVVATDVVQPVSMQAVDLDGDGDADVLSSSRYDDRIRWHENLGSGEFSLQRAIATDADGARMVQAADLDGDGDMDVLSSSLTWYENLAGAFSAGRAIRADDPGTVSTTDLDGDGDVDVLSTSRTHSGREVVWHENLGDGEFSAKRTIATDADRVSFLRPADLDGDGDPDVLSASYGDNKIAWHENLGGGAFSAERVITTAVDLPEAVYAADLDGDGDRDVLSASRRDGKIAWYENQSDHGDDHRDAVDEAMLVTVLPAFLHGVLESAGDRDVFRIATGAGTLRAYSNGPTDTFGRVLDETGAELASNDDGGAGFNFRVDNAVEAGVHYVDVRGYAETRTGPYTLSIEFVADDPVRGEVTVTIAAGPSPIDEGEDAEFTLERSDPAGALTVNVEVTESGDVIAGSTPTTAIFGAGEATAPLHVATEDDSVDEAASEVTATVLPGSGYVPHTSNSANVEVTDNDEPPSVPDAPSGLAASPSDGEATLSWTASADDGGSAVLRHEYRLRTGDAAYGDWIAIPDSAPGGANALGYTVTGLANGERAFFQVRAVNGVGPSEPSNEADATPGADFSAPRNIATDADGVAWMHAVDLDGDGNPDVLYTTSTDFNDNRIAWYANEGGGAFSAPHTIEANADGFSVHAADLDGDGDADVLSASFDDDRIAWYANEGGGTFSAPRTIAADANYVQSVHAADLDGDGDADVFASYLDDRIAWYANEGGGAFSAPRTIAVDAIGAESVHAADLDGDGDADVLAALYLDDRIVWYENEGGAFSARTIAADANYVRPVSVVDLDGDGDADVLAALHLDDRIVWYENDGGGGFSAPQTIATVGADSVHAADLDGDGDTDVLAASPDGDRIVWYENEGGGSFSALRTIATNADSFSMHVADLDGDGDSDVLSFSWDSDEIAWHENLSDHGDDHGNAPDAATLATFTPAFLHGVVESAGDRDVFRMATGAGTLRAYSNGPTDTFGRLLDGTSAELASNDDGGAGTNFRIETAVEAGVHYVEVRHFSTAGTGPYTLSIEFVADDVATVPNAPTGLAVSPGDGEATLSWTASADDGGSAVLRHEYRDRTRDGAYGGWTAIPDSAPGGTNALGYTVTGLANGERVFFQVRAVNAAGSSGPSNEADTTPRAGDTPNFGMHVIDSPNLNLNVEDIYGVDFDGDGDMDFLTGGWNSDVVWYENVDGVFTERFIVREGSRTAYPADVDGDGDADVLSASFSGDRIAWHENDGSGVFEERLITTNADGPRSVHAADLDGDGDADVLSASINDDKIAWYENDRGSFEERVISTDDRYTPRTVRAADLDGDGDVDVLASSQTNNSFRWYENDGIGGFAERSIISTQVRVESMQVTDLDGDGDADVALSDSFHFLGPRIAWYENDGSGVFAERLSISTDPVPGNGALADLDGDGDVDVLSGYRDKIAWWENDEGVLKERVISTGPSSGGVGAADLDGDGDADVLSHSEVDQKIVWHENLSDHGDDHRDTVGGAMLVTALPAFLPGVLESAVDRDVFRITTGAGTLRAYSNGPTDTFGRLLDGTGAQLASNDDAGSGANFRTETAVGAGVHYVEVRHSSATGTGPYTLIVEFVANAGTESSLVSVCGRTPAVRDGIVAAVGAGGCGGVTAQALADVTSLDLSDSGMSALRKDDFAGMPNLRELSLGGGALSRLPAGIFDGLSGIEHLTLSGTGVSALPEGVFGDLHGLRTLSLADNALAALPPGTFDRLRDLERLDLSGNRLETLPEDAFAGMWRLAELRLDGNVLGGLDAGVFSDLDALRLVDLRFNRLAALPSAVFAGLRLDGLRLDGNPGVPFAVDFAVERADRADPVAPAPGTVRLRFAPGAILDRLPFDVSVPAGAQRGALSAAALTIAAGADAGRPVLVTQGAGGVATWVHGGRPQRIEGALSGLEARIAEPVALFAPTANRIPKPVGRLRPHSTTVGTPLALHSAEPACCEVADVAAYFADDDGDLLSYAAASLDGKVATVELDGTRLVFNPGTPGRTVVRLTATDPDGIWAAHEVVLEVLPTPDPGRFDIDVVFVGNVAAERREAVLEAARRWEQVVVGDLGDIDFSGSPVVPGCGSGGPVFGGVLDDLRVYVHDGHRPLAGPRRIRADGGLPADACVWLPVTDPGAALNAGGVARTRAMRQLGHALGFGTLWGALLHREGSNGVLGFAGPLAVRELNAGLGIGGDSVPVAASGAHWNDAWAVRRAGPDVRADVMAAPGAAGFYAVEILISRVTVQSLADLGYRVDLGGADPFPVAAPAEPQPDGGGTPASRSEDIRTGPVETVDRTGEIVGGDGR